MAPPSTRAQKLKAVNKSSNSDAPKTQKTLNSSYITISSNCGNKTDCDDFDLINDLRNKLAKVEYEYKEAIDEKNHLTSKLKQACSKIESREATIGELRKTIEDLTRHLTTQRHQLLECSTQTQTAALSEIATQTDCEHDVQVEKLQEIIIGHSSNNLINRPSKRKSKILILGDSHVRSMSSILQKLTDNTFEILTITKSNALFQNVIENLSDLTKSFTMDDYVVLLAGANNILKNQDVSTSVISSLIASVPKTNLILLSIPYWKGHAVYNNLVHKLNCRLFQYATETDRGQYIRYLDINSVINERQMTRHGLHMTIRAKNIIMKCVASAINSFRCISVSNCNVMVRDVVPNEPYKSKKPISSPHQNQNFCQSQIVKIHV